MPDEFQTAHVRTCQTATGHEPEGIRLGVVAGGIAGVVLLIVMAGWCAYGVYVFLTDRPPHAPEARNLGRGEPSPAGPQLQPDQANQLAALRAAEEQELTAYRWVDRSSGVAQIPIERAMQILAERGLRGATGRPPLEAPQPNTAPLNKREP